MANKPNYGYKMKVRSPEDSKALMRGIWMPAMADWTDIIEDYLELSRKRLDNKLAMFNLQKNLLVEIAELTNFIKGNNNFIRNPESAREFFEPDEEIGDFQLGYWKDQIQMYQLIINALKSIGDGILWRMYKYNRPLIYAMCSVPDSGPLTLDQARINELLSVADAVHNAEVKKYIYHAITNFGRIADLSYQEENQKVSFIEVKSSKKSRFKDMKSRIEKQNERLNNLTSFANYGKGIINNKETELLLLNQQPNTKINEICSIIKKASHSGINSKKLNSYLSFISICPHIMRKLGKTKSNVETEFKNVEAQLSGNELAIYDTTIFLAFSPYKTPLSVYPLSSKQIADIYTGQNIIYFHFSATKFKEELVKFGWEVVFFGLTELNGQREYKLVVNTQNSTLLSIPMYVISRIIFEGLSVNELKNYEQTITKEFDQKHVIIGYKEEFKLWN